MAESDPPGSPPTGPEPETLFAGLRAFDPASLESEADHPLSDEHLALWREFFSEEELIELGVFMTSGGGFDRLAGLLGLGDPEQPAGRARRASKKQEREREIRHLVRMGRMLASGLPVASFGDLPSDLFDGAPDVFRTCPKCGLPIPQGALCTLPRPGEIASPPDRAIDRAVALKDAGVAPGGVLCQRRFAGLALGPKFSGLYVELLVVPAGREPTDRDIMLHARTETGAQCLWTIVRRRAWQESASGLVPFVQQSWDERYGWVLSFPGLDHRGTAAGRLLNFLVELEARVDAERRGGRPAGSFKGRAWSRDDILEWWTVASERYALDDTSPTLRDLANVMGVKSPKTVRARLAGVGLVWPPR